MQSLIHLISAVQAEEEYELKAPVRLHIVRRMKRLLLSFALITILTPVAQAQSSAVGLNLGGATSAADDIELDFGNGIREVYYSLDLESGTALKLKIGQADAEDLRFETSTPNRFVTRAGEIDYVQALIEYRFYEIFGSTSLFAGPSMYRQKGGGDSETNYGLAGGVNAIFPVTRRFGLTGEVAYHWAAFEKEYRFITASGGIRFAF